MVGTVAIFMVAIGSAFGAIVRLIIVGRLYPWSNNFDFPLGILTVNIIGSFLMGILIAFLSRYSTGGGYGQSALFMLIGTGFLGGLTTFSSFALDAISLMQKGNNTAAMIYIFLSVALSLAALFGGMMLIRPQAI